MDAWHWLFATMSGALAGWSLVGARRAGAAKSRGHLLRGLIAAALLCLLVYSGVGVSIGMGALTLALSGVGALVGYIVGRRSSFRDAGDKDQTDA